MSKHTKGPWKRDHALVVDSDDATVAIMCSDEANARLIAAAPALLAACEGVVDDLEYGRIVNKSGPAYREIKAAIAKAKT